MVRFAQVGAGKSVRGRQAVSAAREVLHAALSTFDRFDARPWVQRAGTLEGVPARNGAPRRQQALVRKSDTAVPANPQVNGANRASALTKRLNQDTSARDTVGLAVVGKKWPAPASST